MSLTLPLINKYTPLQTSLTSRHPSYNSALKNLPLDTKPRPSYLSNLFYFSKKNSKSPNLSKIILTLAI